MVITYIIGILKLLITYALLYLPFKAIGNYYEPKKESTVYTDEIHLYKNIGDDGFFMAAMYQDMGNDL